jgi:crotonobetainyl-CoA:carnitine CoA-transferase CaiB-like acyl-CoA transferase
VLGGTMVEFFQRGVVRERHGNRTMAIQPLDSFEASDGWVQVRADENTPAYLRLEQQLRQVRDLNRRKDVWIQDIFTLVAALEDRRVVEYGADAEDRFEYEHHVGDVYRRNGTCFDGSYRARDIMIVLEM